MHLCISLYVYVYMYIIYIYLLIYFIFRYFFNTNQLFDTQNSDVVKCSHTKYVYLYIYNLLFSNHITNVLFLNFLVLKVQ